MKCPTDVSYGCGGDCDYFMVVFLVNDGKVAEGLGTVLRGGGAGAGVESLPSTFQAHGFLEGIYGPRLSLFQSDMKKGSMTSL